MITRTHAILWGALFLPLGCGKLPNPLLPLVPKIDTATRVRADLLHAEEIKELRFTGVQFMRFVNHPIVIKDKVEIDRYLTALRHASCRSSSQVPLNGIDTLEIESLPSKGKQAPNEIFSFNLDRDMDCFGSEFRKEALALQARIAQEDKKAEAAQPHAPFLIANIQDNDTLTGGVSDECRREADLYLLRY